MPVTLICSIHGTIPRKVTFHIRYTVDPLLRGHPDENRPLLKGHFSGAKWVASQEGFYCMQIYTQCRLVELNFSYSMCGELAIIPQYSQTQD